MDLVLHTLSTTLRRPGLWARLGLVVACVVAAGVLFAAALAPSASVAADVVTSVDTQLLDFPPLAEEFARPPERSVVLDRAGNVLAYLKDENRTTVGIAEVPVHVQQAVLATEDADFYAHRGVNWRAIGRASLGNVAAGEVRSGASTVTQQLVKSLTGDDAQELDRKLREAVYAAELEERFSKDEILEQYLNRTYFGQGAYGIGTAAEYYFSKPVSDLTLAEAAILAGIIRAPEVNNPEDDPAAALERRDIVLEQMVEAGFVTGREAAVAQVEPLALNISRAELEAQPFFVDYVRQQLEEDPALGGDRIARQRAYLTGGLTIRTTLDPGLTAIADQAVRDVLTDPAGPNAALTAVDPRSGEILAVGFGPTPYGEGPGQTKVNPALPGLGSPGRQTGSAFKAFEIVTALDQGVSPDFTIDTPSPYRPTGECPRNYNPGNYSDSGGGRLDMRRATAVSSNVYFVHLVDEVTGSQALVDMATRLGIPEERDVEAFCSTVLGTSNVYPLDMASAMGTLANNGVHCKPYAIAEVVDRFGSIISSGGGQCAQAVSAAVAQNATALLRGPIENGTASRNGQIGRPAAGKTGTGQDYKNAWFAGYIPQLSAATWVGYSDADEPMRDARCGGDVTGGCLPTMIWAQFMERGSEALGLPVEGFPRPPRLPGLRVPVTPLSRVSESPSATASASTSASETASESASPSESVSASPTPTASPSASAAPSATPTRTSAPSPTPTSAPPTSEPPPPPPTSAPPEPPPEPPPSQPPSAPPSAPPPSTPPGGGDEPSESGDGGANASGQ